VRLPGKRTAFYVRSQTEACMLLPRVFPSRSTGYVPTPPAHLSLKSKAATDRQSAAAFERY